MKKIISVLLTMIILSAGFFGCSVVSPNTPDTLEVYCVDLGYGTKWCTDLLKLFQQQDWVKEKYPSLNVLPVMTNEIEGFAQTRLDAGRNANTIDLFFTKYMFLQGKPNGLLENLTDSVYNAEVPGEGGVLFKDKMISSYRDSLKYIDVTDLDADPSWYMTPWAGGMMSVVYNETMLKTFGIDKINTTDELIAACATIMDNKDKNNGKFNAGYSIIQSYDVFTYFDALFPIWWAQYEGIDRYLDFWHGIDDNSYSIDIFRQMGRVKSLEVFESILKYSKGYVNPASFRMQFMEAQTTFYKGNGGAFHANGDWFASEMSEIRQDIIEQKGGIDVFKMMRTPIVSSLGEKLGITDAKLSEIISYLDGEITAEPTVSSTTGFTEQEVIDAVLEARRMVCTIGTQHTAVIPEYAVGKDAAVDFLRFMATDIAQEQYIKSTEGGSLPYNYDLKTRNIDLYNSLTDIQKSRHDYFNAYDIYSLPAEAAFPLATYGKIAPFTKKDFFTTFANSSNTRTPMDFYNETLNAWTQSKWTTALADSGIL